MCEPTNKNFAVYFQNIIPSIYPETDTNKIIFSTISAQPSFIPSYRVWNFVCNGTFIGKKAIVTFDASNLINECSTTIRFEGEIYGLLTINNQNFQLQKYVKSKVLKNNNGQVYAIQFILNTKCISEEDITTFFFNITINDSSSSCTNCNSTNCVGNYLIINGTSTDQLCTDSNSSASVNDLDSNIVWTISEASSNSSGIYISDVNIYGIIDYIVVENNDTQNAVRFTCNAYCLNGDATVFRIGPSCQQQIKLNVVSEQGTECYGFSAGPSQCTNSS